MYRRGPRGPSAEAKSEFFEKKMHHLKTKLFSGCTLYLCEYLLGRAPEMLPCRGSSWYPIEDEMIDEWKHGSSWLTGSALVTDVYLSCWIEKDQVDSQPDLHLKICKLGRSSRDSMNVFLINLFIYTTVTRFIVLKQIKLIFCRGYIWKY